MATFASWLRERHDQEDPVGYLAKYWEQVTPGRLSSVAGIKRHLERIGEELAKTGTDDQKQALAEAMRGLEQGADEYHRDEARQIAIEQGAIPAPDEEGGKPPEALAAPLRVADPVPGSAARSVPVDQGQLVLEALSRIEARQEEILAIIRPLQIDFGELHKLAHPKPDQGVTGE